DCETAIASQVLRPQAGPLRDAREHPRADLLAIVKGKDETGRAGAGQGAMGTALPFGRPADAQERREHATRPGRRPVHATTAKTPSMGGIASPFSRRSARIRRASAC